MSITLEDISILLSPTPLTIQDLQQYYVNLVDARGDNPIASLKRRLNKKTNGQLQVLFSGYRGCGKSTELNKLQSEINKDFIVLNFSVLRELDPINMNYVELFILTMEKLFEIVEKYNIDISPTFLKSIKAWTQTEEIEKIRSTSTDISVEAGVETNLGLPWFTNFFAKIRAAGNASFSAKRTIKEAIEHRLSDLIDQCNDLIREVKQNLATINKKGLLIVIEDLDKLSIEKAEELFFLHSHVLTSLQTNVIFTFPIALRHHPKSIIIKSNFDEDFELPMVKVKDKQGNLFEAGRKALFKIITGRIGKNVFENNELIYKFIDMSGGCIRDLFRMIRDAADNALNFDRDKITEPDFYKSFLRLKRDYENTIAEKRISTPDGIVITTVEDYYNTLKIVANSPTKKADNTEISLDLRQTLCILGYNDEGWCDVHPVVRKILEERNLI